MKVTTGNHYLAFVLDGEIPIKEIIPAVFELTGRFELIEKR